ncbi:CAAD domain-containing protein [Fortiea contorta]|uniref:CAAD domain-containing protein n=1 Tax=Fortiea contorta TaxID=1892405 RepID=UPI00034B12DB|nr:CAAD domain-containing protein [Fortiea contorta]
METEQYQDELVNNNTMEGALALPSAGNENLPMLPPASEPETQWERWGRKTSEFLEQLPDYVGRFFQQYKQALITLGLILSAIVTVKVIFALLDAIHGIPLLSLSFELIGIGYVTWFVYRYLIKTSTRQELAAEIKGIKQQMVGEKATEPLNQ